MLLVDKYRPSDLDSLDYHDDISRRLKSLARNPASLPHLFFYGQSGAGKRTRYVSDTSILNKAKVTMIRLFLKSCFYLFCFVLPHRRLSLLASGSHRFW